MKPPGMERLFRPEALEAAEVSDNVAFMNDQMIKQNRSESIGGNAGAVELDGVLYPTMGANGYVDPATGRLTAFGSPQSLTREQRTGTPICFRIAADIRVKGKGFFRITGYDTGRVFGDTPPLTKRATRIIEESVRLWNEQAKIDTESTH